MDEKPFLNAEKKRSVKRILILGSISTGFLLIGTYLGGLVLGIFPMWYQNYAPKQPIPFSHKKHAGKFKIPCLYCHSSAEYAAHAEVPGLETCMNCHRFVKTDSPWIQQIQKAYESNKPIAWVKVHVLPDFVYFNHRPHIAAGVECQTCHGPVETMDKVYQWAGLNMGWCVNCHRNNNYVQEHRREWSQMTKILKGEGEKPFWHEMLAHVDPHNANISCSTCHR